MFACLIDFTSIVYIKIFHEHFLNCKTENTASGQNNQIAVHCLPSVILKTLKSSISNKTLYYIVLCQNLFSCKCETKWKNIGPSISPKEQESDNLYSSKELMLSLGKG